MRQYKCSSTFGQQFSGQVQQSSSSSSVCPVQAAKQMAAASGLVQAAPSAAAVMGVSAADTRQRLFGLCKSCVFAGSESVVRIMTRSCTNFIYDSV
jgi:hypothetical protein